MADEAPAVGPPAGRGRAAGVAVALAIGAALYLALPAVAGLEDTWRLLRRGDEWWLAPAVAFEVASYAGYVVLFHAVFATESNGVGWRRSAEISLAGVAATRLFATAGAGGVVLTAWALRRSGLSRGAVASGITTFLVLLYAVYMAALVIAGLGLRTGLLPGPASFGLTVPPAVLGATVIAIALATALLPGDLGRRTQERHRVVRDLARALGAVARGVRGAIVMLRDRHPGLLGAVAWWGFDVAVLWAAFRAFGPPPPATVLVLIYFVGMLGNTLPLPGGIGGVDGGMIGTAIGFGVDESLAIVAVLAYRAIAFWLPTAPGALAYVRLRRSLVHEAVLSGARRSRGRSRRGRRPRPAESRQTPG